MNIKRIDKINKCNNIYEIIGMLNRKQLSLFTAVVAWYQLHNNMNYFLDERYNKTIFLDICIRNDCKRNYKNIKKARQNIIEYIMKNLNIKMRSAMIKLAACAANNGNLLELNKIANESKADFTIQEQEDTNSISEWFE